MDRNSSFASVLDRLRDIDDEGEPVTLEEIFSLHAASLGQTELSEEERARLLDQVSLDPEAAAKLLGLIRFGGKTTTDEAPNTVERRWEAFRQRVNDEGDGFREAERKPPLRWILAAAAAILLTASLTFWAGRLGLNDIPRSGQAATTAQLNLPIVELLDGGSGPTRGEPVRLPVGADALVVTWSVDRIDVSGSYDLTIIGPADHEPLELTGLQPGPGGVFVVSLPRDLLVDGSSRLELTQGDEDIAQFFLDVEVAR